MQKHDLIRWISERKIKDINKSTIEKKKRKNINNSFALFSIIINYMLKRVSIKAKFIHAVLKHFYNCFSTKKKKLYVCN